MLARHWSCESQLVDLAIHESGKGAAVALEVTEEAFDLINPGVNGLG